MDDSIVWKEAKSHQRRPHHHDEDDKDEDASRESDSRGSTSPQPEVEAEGTDASLQDEEATPAWDDEKFHPDSEPGEDPRSGGETSRGTFSHRQINLKLRRNITALADPAQHQPKLEYVTGSQSFDKWTEAALIAISPSADIILFSGQSPERLIFIAKLRMEPINQYSTKALDIALDFDEHVTSLLCLPIMATQQTALGSVDWTALVVGLSSGYVKFYTEQSICLLSLKFCDEPVTGLKLKTQKYNSNARSQAHFASIVDELLISYKTCAIVTDGIGLFENLRISKEDVVKGGYDYEPAYTNANLPTILTCVRWKYGDNSSPSSRVVDADLLGVRSISQFDTLKSSSMNIEHVPSKSLARTIVLVGQNPFLSCQRESREAQTHSYSEMLGSLLPFWSKPQPSRVQINDINCSCSSDFYDKGRLATSVISSPDRRLAVVTDDFGRVMLLDVTNWLIVRTWKGYRNAQCGWVEVKRNPEERDSPYASFLIIYAPKRGLLEVWSAQRGPRVAAFDVGKSCRLLYAGHKMLNMRAETVQRTRATNLLIDQSYSSNCYLLNAKSETLFSIELPYTYSLYKYGDLKSRDRLLINELVNLLQQDAEVGLISETLHRMSLAESLELSIQRAAGLLQPDKLAPIMENLIIRIMKNYDNHSGETMTTDDQSIVELCKRLIRLCTMFSELSRSTPSELSLPDVNRRLIEEYDEHPREIDEFAEHLGWTANEVLRYLSLLALERSYRRAHVQNPWPNLGEPLAWSEFVSCFDLSRLNLRTNKSNSRAPSECTESMCIKLKRSDGKLVWDERILKTALFMYNRLSESFYRATSNSSKTVFDFSETIGDNFTYLEPSSRLVLLFHFWLSTKLCNHWKMWAFLQHQVGQISDELKVIAMTQDNDDLLIETWKRIYQLILEGDNTYAALIATAAVRSDTIRMISDNEKRDKLARETKGQKGDKTNGQQNQEREEARPDGSADSDEQRGSTVDWECLCVDAERMSIVSQQIEDVFLLNLLLRYSPVEGHLTDKFVYRVPRISVASILRGGPTIVSELVAQWMAQANVHPKLFIQHYGAIDEDAPSPVFISNLGPDSSPLSVPRDRSKLWPIKQSADGPNNEEHAKELLHHTRTSFPHSLEPDVILLNCVWEFCQRWAANMSAPSKDEYLNKALDCLSMLTSKAPSVNLKHSAACLAYKTFFQRTFERLAALIECNQAILSRKCAQSSRDTLTRRELNMSAECLEDFVFFCFKLSDFMLETYENALNDDEQVAEGARQLRAKLLCLDEWWSGAAVAKMLARGASFGQGAGLLADIEGEMGRALCIGDRSRAHLLNGASSDRLSLMRAAITGPSLFDINTLVELNRLAVLMMLIFKLKLIKCYPLSLIGEQSRQALKLDVQQSPATGADIKTRRGFLNELRHTFARKCIVSMVARLTDETSVFEEDDEDDDNDNSGDDHGAGGGGKIDDGYGRASASGIFGRNFYDDQADCGTKDGSLAARPPEVIDTDEKPSCASVKPTDGSNGGHSSGGGSPKAGGKSRAVKTNDEAATKREQISSGGQQASGEIISHRVARHPTARAASGIAGGSQFAPSQAAAAAAASASAPARTSERARALRMDASDPITSNENNEFKILFAHLLSLANEWQSTSCDELHLELVFELFRCNHDKLASQLANRIQDKQTLSSGLLKISSQRILVLFGLSPHLSVNRQWCQRADKWSLFQPNVASWLKGIQREVAKRELANLVFQDTFRPQEAASLDAEDFSAYLEQSFGLRLFVLNALRQRTKLILETVTNYLEGQANRLAYDLLQLLESDRLFCELLRKERILWSSEVAGGGQDGSDHEARG